MNIAFLVVLFAGLALASVVMWGGVERRRQARTRVDSLGRELADQPVSLALPAAAGALLSSGFVGYLLAVRGIVGPVVALVVAVVVAVCGGLAATILVTKWAVPSALAAPEDPRYVLQGTPGVVLDAINRGGAGRVRYEANGQAVTLPAQSLDGSDIPSGADVVIDRIEGETAFVEPWSVVETRL